jgi:molecular chaperone HtpG
LVIDEKLIIYNYIDTWNNIAPLGAEIFNIGGFCMSQNDPGVQSDVNGIPFKAETRQLLEILIHSLYTDHEVFLRELISNASDAITKMNFEMLTNRSILDPETELGIWITADPEEKTITIRDSGIGMTAEELSENLGTIAHSGAKSFIQAVQQSSSHLADLIGQFGVGFYSAFMVAEWIHVTSRSYKQDAQAASWFSKGEDTFIIESSEKTDRGTEVLVKLKEDASEFAQEYRLREIIRKHSNYIPFPIYLGEKKEQVNKQTALWRQSPREVEEQQYDDFYKQLTMEFEPPLAHAHISVDAPVQMYALLYVPDNPERGFLSGWKQDGLALYARKVLIQEYSKDLLPDFLRFVRGVVDSEDIPLNVSRESVQSTRVMTQIKKVLSAKVLDTLKSLGSEKPEKYLKFWNGFGNFIKEGVASDLDHYEQLLPLLRFHTMNKPEEWISLSDYVQGMKTGQAKIYFILGEDDRSIVKSPHLEVFRKLGYDVLLMTDPIDSFMLLRLKKYSDFEITNASNENINAPDEKAESEEQPEESKVEDAQVQGLIDRFKARLGDQVTDVRSTDRLVESPSRLVDPEGTMDAEMQRVYRYLNKEYSVPKKILELNAKHAILLKLAAIDSNDPLNDVIIDQIYEDALLIEGLHPDPASMISRIQKLMEVALR